MLAGNRSILDSGGYLSAKFKEDAMSEGKCMQVFADSSMLYRDETWQTGGSIEECRSPLRAIRSPSRFAEFAA